MNFDIEEKFGNIVVGIDEVGRGPLAGPVIAVAVYIKRSLCHCMPGDSFE